jgi:ABC-type lipoprotein export system ATPase subunit
MSDSVSAFIRLENVSRVYQSGSDRVVALDDVTFEVAQGERVALLGKSGSGKSTLLGLLGGLDRVTSGTIHVAGNDLATLSSDELAGYRLRSVGMVFQAFNLIQSRTAIQNVEVPFMLAGRDVVGRRAAAVQALESVGLKERANHRPTELSGGEQQRVAIARALVNAPSLILADEPTGNLDSATAGEVIELLGRYSEENQTTVVLVTHDEELATSFANRTLRLRDGQLSGS